MAGRPRCPDDGPMGLIVVAADPESYRAAAGHLGGTGTPPPASSLPSLGHAGAEAALQHFSDAMAAYHQQLCAAAADGAGSLQRLATNFARADQ